MRMDIRLNIHKRRIARKILFLLYIAFFSTCIQAENSLSITSSHEGKTYTIGDTLTVTWELLEPLNEVIVELSLDGGLTFFPLHGEGLDASEKTFSWRIPEKVTIAAFEGDMTLSTITDQALCIVHEYDDFTNKGATGKFAIAPGKLAARNAFLAGRAGINHSSFASLNGGHEWISISLNGRTIGRHLQNKAHGICIGAAKACGNSSSMCKILAVK